MGDAFGDGGENERPAHEVTESDFYISRHEVTVAQFKLFVGETEYRTSGESLHYCWRQAGRTRRKMGWRCL
jgi:formylglycine-generating enzyme required for sulfatase activity